ncbi:hypothetical protein ACFL5V_00900 [Fibrobacterota bacterium]
MNNRITKLMFTGWRNAFPLVSLFVLFFFGFSAYGEPYMAVRTGLKCVVCHVNASGGGKRTDFGVQYGHYKLKMKSIRPSKKPAFFGGQISEMLSVGANLRVDNATSLDYQPTDPITGLDTLPKVLGDNKTNIKEADLYFQMDLIQDFVLFYADADMMQNGWREYWTMMKFPLNSYVKIGYMLLPYGLRLYDDDAFIRAKTGYTYFTRDMAGEIGFEPGPFSLIANLTDARFSTVATVVYRRWRVGGSFQRWTEDHPGLEGTNFWGDDYRWGVFAGTNFGKFTLMGEGDIITKENRDQFAGFLELNYHIMDGLNYKTTYEFFDRNTTIMGNEAGLAWNRDGQDRLTVGVEAFVTQFTELALFYRMNRFIPQAQFENQDQVILRFVGFF